MISSKNDMGFLIISEDGAGLGLALRLQEEGHKVSITIGDSHTEMLGLGLVEKSNNPDYIPVMVSDSSGYGMTLDAFKAQGGMTYSGSQLADKLENERTFSSKVFQENSIQEPKYKEFNSWEEAEKFVLDSESRLVFKPEGEFSGNLPSYVSENTEDMIEAFSRFRKIVGDKEPSFLLQGFVEGTCISSEIWCAKGKILRPTNHTLERKQLMNDDLGPSGGCTGNIVWACLEEDCPLCKNLFSLESFLEENQYNGPLDINTVVTKEGEVYALEFTPRFGYDAFPTYLYGLFEGDFGSFIYESCRGNTLELPLKNGFAAGVRVSIPPWPFKGAYAESGLEIRGLRKSDYSRFYPYEVGLQEDKIITSGGCGVLGIAVGYGETIEIAFEEAYKLAKKIRVPDKQFRTDLAEVFTKEYRQIQRSLSAQEVNT